MDWLSTLGQVILFAAVIWLGVGFVVWLPLGIHLVVLVRRRGESDQGTQQGGWKPSMRSGRGLALLALYTSIGLVPLGVGAMLGWNSVGYDRLNVGVFLALTLIADLLTVMLVVVYVRVVVLMRRGESSPGRVLWAALASTIVGQAVALAVLVALALPQWPYELRP
jgi:hypothetical protein